MSCEHLQMECLNHFDYVRKYRCLDCGEVMMCACDEERGKRFLSHQLEYGKALRNQEKIPVTLGFQKEVCAACRGLPLEAHPVASIPGRTSKIKRFYWRELFFRTSELFYDWLGTQDPTISEWGVAAQEKREIFEKEALAEIKKLHARAPIYSLDTVSKQELIKRYNVEVVLLEAEHVHREGERKTRVRDGVEELFVEDFVARFYERQGGTVYHVESVPFHVLFGAFFGALIQEPDDPHQLMRSFGDRSDFFGNAPMGIVSTFFPTDFGTPGFYERREAEILKFLAELPTERDGLLWFFDRSLEGSSGLLNYLWASDPEDQQRARVVIEILPPSTIVKILKYLIGDYWGRFVGWPDLIVVTGSEFKFVEVKSSNDKLSDDQLRWIEDNSRELGFAFSVVKVGRPRRAPN